MAIINQEETMMSIAGRNMWRMFSNTTKRSAQVVYQASKTSAVETGRATAGAGLVFLGFYAYDRLNPPPPPSHFKNNIPQEERYNFSPK